MATPATTRFTALICPPDRVGRPAPGPPVTYTAGPAEWMCAAYNRISNGEPHGFHPARRAAHAARNGRTLRTRGADPARADSHSTRSRARADGHAAHTARGR